MSDNSNIWYLDRGKNFFTDEGKELFNTIINIVNTYSYLSKITSSELIETFPQKMKKSGNPNALLTTTRNIGIINKENKLGKNIQFYLNDQLKYEELIFENLTKVNYDKESSYPIKPFIVICKTLYRLYTLDKNEAYITKADCIKYLYKITDYFQITNEYCDNIIKNRSFEKESAAVLDIWFNALQNFEIFSYSDNTSILRLNEEELNYYKFIDEKGGNIPCYLRGNSKYASYYDDLGSIDLGINYIIPSIEINKTKNLTMEEVKKIYEYLFGICPYENSTLVNNEYYGIYRPFKSIKNIAIRKIYRENAYIGNLLFVYNNYLIEKEINN